MISLRQLQCLVALSDCLHFRKAAETLNLSQPALSAQIVLLEETLGAILVERTRRKVLMTPVGREVAARARAILADVRELEGAVKQSRQPLTGTLRLGVLRTLGPYLLPHMLPALRTDYPGLKLYLREEPRQRLLADLARGDLDMILLAAAPRDDEQITVVPLFREPLWAALPLGHPLASREFLVPSDLAGERMLLLEMGDGLREPAMDVLRQGGAEEQPDFRATSLDALRQMVATGLGPTLLPALYTGAEALDDTQIVMRPFAPPTPSRAIDLAWRRTTSRTDEFRLFADLIRANLPPVVEATTASPAR